MTVPAAAETREHGTQASIRAAQEFAACLVERRREDARLFLDTTTPDVAARVSRPLFREADCLNLPNATAFTESMKVQSPAAIQRGLLAEALINGMIDQPVPEAQPLRANYRNPWFKVSAREQAVDEMAICVAATNPSGIMKLVRAEAESAEERAAIASLSPSLNPCLVTNAKLIANRQSLRAALAEALYHRIATPELLMTAEAGDDRPAPTSAVRN
ncbi:hypothetical protein [Sphingomonas alpina]|uniref:Uncharacterized protein n=1 Tax=Sphingomonas alpina TaxID=653931 RepID=A0A7H0LPG1_9SPHN|nr:hypothetical protein [Sphingomonas alpina]QNQ11564.1 hypothetical protein H3Z74_10760 [Sphingomonas alpina]